MTDTFDRHHNAPPLADQIELAYSVPKLATDHADLADRVQALIVKAAMFEEVDSKAHVETASTLVIELRDLAKTVDDEHDAIKRPVLDAGRNVDQFFFGLNNSDTKKPGALTRNKMRIERLIRDYGFKVAEQERQEAAAAAAKLREDAAKAAEAALAAEAANKPQIADIIVESAIKTEAMADSLDERATGPVQEVARMRTSVATAGVRAVPGFEIVDREALQASMGPLGRSFTGDAIMAAIRKFRSDSEAFGKWEFKENDQEKPKRVVVAKPDLPGVEFFIGYAGNVRA